MTALWSRRLEERACDMWSCSWQARQRAMACTRPARAGIEKQRTPKPTFFFHGWNSKELTTQRAVQRSTSDMAVLLCNAAEPGFSYRARPRRATPSVRACPVSTDVTERGVCSPGLQALLVEALIVSGQQKGLVLHATTATTAVSSDKVWHFKWRRSASPERVAGPRRFRQPRRRGCLRLLLHLPAAVGGGRGHGPGGAAPGLRGAPRLGREPLPRCDGA